MKGFTLIELLVVVLIIGILSSVALPQYTKAVLKSRTAEAWTNLKNLNMAGNAYCLENPSATSLTMDDLAINVQDSQNFEYLSGGGCSSESTLPFSAHYLRTPSFYLFVNPKTGRRSCTGTGCKDIGFTKESGDTGVCTANACGSGSTCYYAD